MKRWPCVLIPLFLYYQPVFTQCNVDPDFTFSPVSDICGQEEVSFTALDGTATRYEWSFGKSGQSVVHSFSSTGQAYTENITLTVFGEDDQGNACSVNTTQPINIAATPSIEIFPTSFHKCISANSTDSDFTISIEIRNPQNVSYEWDWGDGTVIQTSDPIQSHTYDQFGAFPISISLDNGNCIGYFRDTAVFFRRPSASLLIDQTDIDICVGEPVTVTNNTNPSDVEFYIWDWGDNSPNDTVSDNSTPTHVYTSGSVSGTICEPQRFEITLIAYNSCGANFAHDNSSPVFVNIKPPVNFSMPDQGCVGEEIRFCHNLCNAQNYSWDLGNGETSDEQCPRVTYTQPGKYYVTLIGSNECGTNTLIDSITITEPPNLSITPSATRGCNSLDVDFTNVSPAVAGVTYDWRISPNQGYTYLNGTNSRSEAPQINFGPGTYEVSTTARNACGEDTYSVTIEVNEAPAPFFPELPVICAGETIVLSHDLDLSNTWTWDNGNNETSTLQNFSTSYNTSGTYTVSLSGDNECGDNSFERLLTVTDLPTLSIQASAISGCGELDVVFTNNSTPNTGVTYVWDIAPIQGYQYVNGTNANSPAPEIRFLPGEYLVTVNASNNCGGNGGYSQTIIVNEAPMPFFEELADVCVGETVSLSHDIDQGDVLTWDNGNGETSSSSAFETVYDAVGIYTVSLSGDNECGANSFEREIVVTDQPVLQIQASATEGCDELEVSFNNSSPTSVGVNYQWTISPNQGYTFINGTNAQSDEPRIRFGPGEYQITGSATNLCGQDQYTETIIVNESPQPFFDELADICVGESLELSHSVDQGDVLSWDNGDGETSTLNPFSTTYDAVGVYTISLSGSNECGANNFERELIVTDMPQAVVLPSDTAGCDQLTVNFDNQSSPAIGVNYNWNINPTNGSQFINGNDAQTNSPSVSFGVGIYQVDLIASNGCGQDVYRDTIRVGRLPFIDFPEARRECDTLTYFPRPMVSSVESPITSYRWEINGPGIAEVYDTEFLPQAIIFSPGTYTISYAVTNACGTQTVEETVIVDALITNMMVPPDFSNCLNEFPINLSASPTNGTWSGPGNVIQEDGLFSPASAGEYELEYSIGTGSCRVADTTLATVLDTAEISLSASATFCDLEQPIQLNAFPEGGVWGGSPAVDGSGLYTPSLAPSITDVVSYEVKHPQTGCVSIAYQRININSLPEVTFEIPTEACTNTSIPISINTPGAVRWLWDFGNNTSSTDQTPNLSFPDPGMYEVSLTVANANDCENTYRQSISIYDVPEASFIPDITEGCGPDLLVRLENTSSEQGGTYTYDFSPGTVMQAGGASWEISFPQDNDGAISYDYSIKIENSCGSDTYTNTVVVRPSPTVDFGPFTDSICSLMPVNFRNLSKGGPNTYVWDLGNGNTSMDSVPETQFYLYEGLGDTVYTIKLTASNDCGIVEQEQSIRVYPRNLQADFNIDILQGCVPFEVRVEDLSGAPFVTYCFENDVWLSAKDTSYTYTEAGFFTIRQVVHNLCSYDTIYRDIRVLPNVAVDIMASTPRCVGAAIEFNPSTSQGISSFQWDFGDGSPPSSSLNPSHTYNSTGSYTVSLLTLADTFNCPATQSIDITVGDIPSTNLSISPTDGCVPAVLSFTNESDPNHFYYWEFGDAPPGGSPSTSTQQNPIHIYEDVGTFTIQLRIEDLQGCVFDTAFDFRSFPTPEALFSPTDTSFCQADNPMQFNNLSSSTQTGYIWDFGDGGNSTQFAPTKLYDSTGTFTVRLLSENIYGCQNEAEGVVVVYPQPMANFDVEQTINCDREIFQFINLSENGTQYLWDFGDGIQSNTENPAHKYGNPGRYDVSLQVSYEDLCFDEIVIPQAVDVRESPFAAFEIVDTDSANIIGLVNRSQFSTQYLWQIIDSNGDTLFTRQTAADSAFTYHFDISGTYSILLTSYNQDLVCADTALKSKFINLPPRTYIPTAFTPNGDGNNDKFFFHINDLASVHMQIFNRWGQLVFETRDPNDRWDGRSKGGVHVQEGVYVYLINVVFNSGLDEAIRGTVTVIR